MIYAPAALVAHANELTLASFVRQHFGYGKGAWRYHRARVEGGAGGVWDELGFYRTRMSYTGPVLREAGPGQQP